MNCRLLFQLIKMDVSTENEASTSTPTDTIKTKEPEPEEPEIPRPLFKCECCDLHEEYDYFGTKPPFATKIKFNENCYVMKDPFAPAPQHAKTTNCEYFLALGADCAKCDRKVCRGPDCSFFYLKTYCLACAGGMVKVFPLEVQTKIRKQIAVSHGAK